ncbi:MFS transporter [Microbacterium barkeri]|uniref:MFS transporter n=1 Tax=Microbacterium barkeri TaxID=33917 RepID=A0A9W6H153_9MICO|nr:MFS transporter [Microbacterium barkeri]MDR6875252.1 MFS family permease [Microbacterium barkeri]GLJ60585.1 MFS transporter [Microbacterium barkeri]
MTDIIARAPVKAWRMLVLGVLAQAAGTMLVSTPAYLIPLLHLERGMSLAEAGALAAAPTLGMVTTLVLWGHLADRHGERWVIAGGLALTAVFALAASAVSDVLGFGALLLLGGAASASVNSASGRIVVGWFPRRRRGTAMGIRQMSQPLGVAVAALVVPGLADVGGIAAPLLVSAAATGLLAVLCALGVENPPRTPAVPGAPAGANPYRRSGFLARVHAVSLLLVFPQFLLSTFGMVWLIAGLGWDAAAAGALIAASQFVGAFGRIAVGALSDRVGSRMRVLRWVAVSGVVVMAALALVAALEAGAAAAVVLVIATSVTVADNGLAFTSVAEAAGSAWSGKALGIQNTGQFVAASAVGPVMGALITAVGFPLAFALTALVPLAAYPLIPRHDEHAA